MADENKIVDPTEGQSEENPQKDYPEAFLRSLRQAPSELDRIADSNAELIVKGLKEHLEKEEQEDRVRRFKNRVNQAVERGTVAKGTEAIEIPRWIADAATRNGWKIEGHSITGVVPLRVPAGVVILSLNNRASSRSKDTAPHGSKTSHLQK